MSFWKDRRPILEDLWRKLTQDQESGELKHEDWNNMLIEHGVDMTETERDELWNLMGDYDELYRSEWMDYWRLSLDSPYWIKVKQLYFSLLQNIDRNNIPNKTITNNVLCYQWRLPRYQSSDIELLFSGYIQRISPNLYVPIDIIYICMYYYHYNTILDKIKNCDTSQSFSSGTFEYKSCKFRLKLYIDKDIDADDDEYGDESGYISFSIVCVAMPKHIKALKLEYSWNIMEKFIIHKKQSIFNTLMHQEHVF